MRGGPRCSARGPSARCADQRSAFQAVPALFRGQRYAVRGPAARCADRRSAFQAVPALLARSAVRGSRPCGPRCRPEVGVPSRPRALARSAVRGSRTGGTQRTAQENNRQRTPFAARVFGGKCERGKTPPFTINNDQSELAAARPGCAREFRLPARSAGRFKRGAQLLTLPRVPACPVLRPPLGALDGWMRGLEPPTTGTTIRCSAIELHPPPNRGNGGRLARQGGFEPPTRGLEGRRSILLSYWRSRAS